MMIDEKYYWSDSEVAIAWIKGTDKKWKPWIQSRVNKIKEISDVKSWNHVSTKINPADIGTHEVTALKIADNDQWWYGPSFLKEKIVVPLKQVNLNVEEAQLIGIFIANSIVPVSVNNEVSNIIDVEKFSSLKKLLRVTAYVLRFVDGCWKRTREINEVKVEEMNHVLNLWVKGEQRKILPDKLFPNKKKQLNLFLDDQGVLRLKGCLGNSLLCYEEKYPMFIDRKSFTKLIIMDAHEKVKHMRTISTLNEVKTRFYFSCGKQIVTSAIKHCVICKHVIGKPIIGPPPPDLPSVRVAYEFAYCNVGIDYAGPVFVKDIYANSSVMHKAWICLFTCAATRSVHIELCPTMSSAGLIRCLKRFIARRGKFKMAISDNFQTFLSEELKQFLAAEGISWKYILANSPWWGAFYERLIRIIKEALKKCIGKAKLSYEELETVLVEIETVINCRPLTYLFEDTEQALTPSHLVIGRRLISNIGSNVVDSIEHTPEILNSRYRYLQSLIDHYWKRFQSEYLLDLHQHHINVLKGTMMNFLGWFWEMLY